MFHVEHRYHSPTMSDTNSGHGHPDETNAAPGAVSREADQVSDTASSPAGPAESSGHDASLAGGPESGTAEPALAASGAGERDALDGVLEHSRELGFLGPGRIGPQRSHARSFIALLDGAPLAIDLGSGGGLPGLVLAWEQQDLELILVDAMQRRCEFLEEALVTLRLTDRVRVVCGRAEELARHELRASVPLVVARSFGAPAVLAECAVGLLDGPGARLLVSEPPDAQSSRWPADGLERLGLRTGRLESSHGGTVQELVATTPCPEQYPRRVGIPTKRPLF